MNRVRLAIPLALVAAGVGACGSTSNPTGVTVVVNKTPTAAAAAAAGAAAAPPATTTPKAAAPAPVVTAAPKPGAAAAPPAKVITRAVLPGPPRSVSIVAIRCLEAQGLVHVGQGYRPGVWIGNDPGNGKSVFVDGPYKTLAAADRSARTLIGVESAERGGRFVVSAVLTSHLSAPVHSVAKCLDATGQSF
jgi:hypothetical protein